MKWRLFGFITTATLFGSVAIIPQETEHHAHWAYEGKDGPNKWATLDPAYSECKVGHHQSPIDIRHTEKAGLPPIQFDYSPTPLKIVDNGHTVMVNLCAWELYHGRRSSVPAHAVPFSPSERGAYPRKRLRHGDPYG